ncbi:MAG: GNAT family N-acetyltransferase [Pseudomonadota bacterium]
MDRAALMRVVDATWPAVQTETLGPWHVRLSPGGGKRVNATRATGPVSQADIVDAEAYQRACGQTHLFQVEVDTELDTVLAQNGYLAVDETLIYCAESAPLAAQALPSVTAFPIWPPLQIMRDIWAAGGIGADRVAVMERAACAKVSILGRTEGRAAGAAFVGVHEGCVMVHALEILTPHRRKGLARHLMIAAARWGAEQGAEHMAVLVTAKNEAARALYQSLGMVAEPGYHYRVKAD